MKATELFDKVLRGNSACRKRTNGKSTTACAQCPYVHSECREQLARDEDRIMKILEAVDTLRGC